MSDTTNGNSQMPWQVKAIGLIGAPTAIACYLVYILAGEVKTVSTETRQGLTSHASQTTELINRMDEANREQKLLKLLLQRICVNTAKTEQTRADCFR